MFIINYRIVDDINELKSMTSDYFDSDYGHASGFIEIRFGEQKEGSYYHENPIREGEIGGEYIDYWLNKILDVLNTLPLSKYAAFKELETINRWLEFQLFDNHVVINTAIDKKEVNNKLFVSERFDGFDYVEPIDFSIEFTEFKSEVRNKASRFVAELENLNPELLKTKMVKELIKKIDNLK